MCDVCASIAFSARTSRPSASVVEKGRGEERREERKIGERVSKRRMIDEGNSDIETEIELERGSEWEMKIKREVEINQRQEEN